MSKPEVLEKQAMSVTEVKDILKKIQKRDEELNFRSNRTLEYANEVAKLKSKEAKDMYKKLEELNLPRVKPEFLKKILDILPTSEKSLKSLISDHSLTMSSENIKKTLAVIKEFAPEDKKSKKKKEKKE